MENYQRLGKEEIMKRDSQAQGLKKHFLLSHLVERLWQNEIF